MFGTPKTKESGRRTQATSPSLVYADGNTVVLLFDAAATARDCVTYHNAYTWYFQMKDAKVVKQ